VSGYLATVRERLAGSPPAPARGFAAALRAGASVAVIAEVKRSSPSQGAIRPDADAAETARRYEDGGAAAVSVLCAREGFDGSLDDLRAARAAVAIPALAKDFLLYAEQVAAHRLAGADAVLVILAMLSDAEARTLLEAARLLGVDALVEAHTAEEVERAGALDAEVIGVNARDLSTLEVDVERQLRLLDAAPAGAVLVAESGVASARDVERARDAGADAVLVGSALMHEPALLAELAAVPR
jgi:indole-3-glycerol phosphate synthase